MTKFDEMMNTMMENMMDKMMSTMMEKMMSSMMSSFGMEEEKVSAPAEIEKEEKPIKTARKLTAEDIISAEEKATSDNAELGYWEGVTKKGVLYRWYGWANPTTGERVFPGKQLYHVNDFYLKRDYGAYHPGKTTSYKFKGNGLKTALMNYKVHKEVDPKDAKAFIAFMQEKEEKKAERVHDTDIYTNWVKTTK